METAFDISIEDEHAAERLNMLDTYNWDFEISLFEDALEAGACGSEAWGIAEQYAYLNEMTVAYEAILGAQLSVTHKQWDDERRTFMAYGEPVDMMFSRALARIDISNPSQLFEYERNELELREQELVAQLFEAGELESQSVVVFSLAPEVLNETARKFGYEENLAVIRMHTQIDEQTIETTQLRVESSSIPAAIRTLKKLGSEIADSATTTEVLATPAVVASSQSIEAIASIYDQQLELEGDKPHFLGRKNHTGDYSKLRRERARLEHEARPYIEKLVSIDKVLAYKAKNKIHTREEIIEAKRQTLKQAWTALAHVVDSEYLKYAPQIKDKTVIRHLNSEAQKTGDYDTVLISSGAVAHSSGVDFSFCGGRLSTERNPAVTTTFEAGLKCVTCPYCFKLVDAIKRGERLYCPNNKCAEYVGNATTQKSWLEALIDAIFSATHGPERN